MSEINDEDKGPILSNLGFQDEKLKILVEKALPKKIEVLKPINKNLTPNELGIDISGVNGGGGRGNY